MDELEYPLNVEILRMGGKDVSGNDIFFKITYLREDVNSYKMVISDGTDSRTFELEKDLKFSWLYKIGLLLLVADWRVTYVFILNPFE